MLGHGSIGEYAISEAGTAPSILPSYPGTGTPPSYPVPLPDLPNERHHRIMLARSIALAMQGKTNNIIQSVTLTASTTTTVLSHPLINYFSGVFLSPASANAAAAMDNIWFSDQLDGSVTIHHDSTADTDRTFKVVIIG